MIDADNMTRKKERLPLIDKDFLRDMGATAVFVAISVLILFNTFTFSGVQGRSMEPTFSEGEHLLALKLDNNYEPRRGDIVGFVTDQVKLSDVDGELLQRVVGLL